MTTQSVDVSLDASGLTCPMPLLKAKLALNGMQDGQVLEVIATDAGSARDIPAYVELSPHTLLSVLDQGERYTFFIRCGAK
ncbi:MAG: sulfurtransferase TusA family protein [Marinobacter sp.]|nr:sulfurtransferase TusA family protein [Marinobacter sp.]